MSLQLLVQQGERTLGTYRVEGERYEIGRLTTNRLVLPEDTAVSRLHALIEPVGEQDWQLTDLSANGLEVNSRVVDRNVPVPLVAGDVVQIGGYTLTVLQEVAAPALPGAGAKTRDPLDLLGGPVVDASAAGADDPGGVAPASVVHLLNEPVIRERFEPSAFADDPFAPVQGSTSASRETPAVDANLPGWAQPEGAQADPAADPDESTGPSINTDPFHRTDSVNSADPFSAAPSAATSPRNPETAPPAVPQDEQAAVPVSSSAVAPSAAAGAQLAPLATALGLPADSLRSPEQLALLGTVFRTLLSGLVDVLQNRAEVKNQMKLERTVLQGDDNNPLKVAPNVDVALRWMFLEGPAGFQAPAEAAAAVMADIAAHELALIAGLQNAQRQARQDLDPDRLERLFREQMTGTGVGLIDKARYWQFFRNFFAAEMVDRDLLTAAFAEGYEAMSRRVAQSTSPMGNRTDNGSDNGLGNRT